MHPRTLAVLAFTLLAGALVLRQVVTYFGLLPVSEEAVLKRAVSLSVIYFDGGRTKTQTIKDDSELREVLATLKIKVRGDYYYGSHGMGNLTSVQFYFPDGSSRGHSIEGPNHLGNYAVDPAFYRKLTEVISKREGHPVDLSKMIPPAVNFNPIQVDAISDKKR